jgi:hypothetical protein
MKNYIALFIFCFCIKTINSQPLSPEANRDFSTFNIHPQNPAIFSYKGKPTLLIGSGEHYGAVMNLDFDYKKYLATLKQDNLNITRLFTGAHHEVAASFGIQRNTMAPSKNRFVTAWARNEKNAKNMERSDIPNTFGTEGVLQYDLEKWDENYFLRLTDFMQTAQANGVIVEVNLFSAIYDKSIWALSPLNPKNNIQNLPDSPYQKVHTIENGAFQPYLEAYVRKMVRALNVFDNFYFEIQNEPWADNGRNAGNWNDYIQGDLLKESWNTWRTTIDMAHERSLKWQKRIGEIIKEEENLLAKKHLISQNYGNFRYPLSSVEPTINMMSFHYCLPEVVAQNAHFQKPICFNETGFSGSDGNIYRRQAWRFMMSGGAQFNNLDYSFTVGKEDGTDTTNIAPGQGSPRFRQQLKILRGYLESFNLIKLKPDNQTIKASMGATSFCLSDKATQWAIFCESYEPFTLVLSLPKGNYKATWMDVLTGKEVGFQAVNSVGGDVKILGKEGFGELALKVVKH